MMLIVLLIICLIIMNVYSYKQIIMKRIPSNHITRLFMSTINDNKLINRLKVKKILEATDRYLYITLKLITLIPININQIKYTWFKSYSKRLGSYC